MSGQMKLSKKNIVAQYIEITKPYEQHKPLNFDLRAYASFVKEKKLEAKDITPEIMNKFIL